MLQRFQLRKSAISLNTFHVSDIVEIYTQGQTNDYVIVVTVDLTTSADNVYIILNITIVNVLHEYYYTTIL